MTYSQEAVLTMGATGFLPKPFRVSELLEKLDGHLSERTQLARLE